MELRPIPEMIDGLPNFCGAEAQVEQVTAPANQTSRNGDAARINKLAASSFQVPVLVSSPQVRPLFKSRNRSTKLTLQTQLLPDAEAGESSGDTILNFRSQV